MKFKVGDRVKTRKGLTVGKNYGDWAFCSSMEQWKGKIMTIRKVRFDSYKVEENNWDWSEEMLELAEYTYEDLKKSSIGTKVTFKDGIELVRESKIWFCGPYFKREMRDLMNLKDNYDDLGKIVKIEEPTYSTVYEYKPEILDEVEKRYLRGVIRPFRNNVEVIRKLFSPTKGKYYIQIRYKNESPTNLPYFESEEMYKNMKTDSFYTLEELGL